MLIKYKSITLIKGIILIVNIYRIFIASIIKIIQTIKLYLYNYNLKDTLKE